MELEAARAAVRIARQAITEHLGPAPPTDPASPFRGEPLPRLFDERRGVFVTLLRHPAGSLRGCIGFPLPVHPLRVGVPRAAVSAAVDDPRFPPLNSVDLEGTRIDVSVLTPPVPVPENGPARRLAIVVGRDGLVVDRDGASGILLPQVAVEQGWNSEEFLDAVCEKAGLPSGAWLAAGTDLYRFSAEIARETVPGGAVESDPTSPAVGSAAPRA